MQDLVNKYLKKFKRERRMRRRLGSVLVALALVVSLGVYWQLKLTGAALTNETFCGLEEHQHSDDCYEWVLVCGYDDVTETTVTLEELEALWEAGVSVTEVSAAASETTAAAASEMDAEVISGHSHTAECYQTVTTLVCGLTESAGHTHSESCYSTVLTCGLEESEGHAHSESCYDEEGNLICGLEESEGHTHDEGCYTTELTCGLVESEGHTHDASCYVTEEVLICGLEDTAGVSEDAGTADVTAADGENDIAVISDTNETDHVHTAACYEKVAVCGLEEHTHTAACLSDVTADVETAADWEATIPANLSDDWAEAVVAIAQSQLNYTESTLNYVLDEDGETLRGYTRYGAWAGNEYGDWDAMFASFCLHYAGISTTDFPESTGAYAWAVKLQNLGLYAAAADYTPAAGDLVFLDSDADEKIDRVGIVVSVDAENDSLTVIEGDYAAEDGADAVCEVVYGLSDEAVVGYGVLPEKDSNLEVYTASADGVTVTVTAPIGALPEGAELCVSLIEEGSDAYNAAAEAIGYEETVEAAVSESEDGIALAFEEDVETETVAASGLAVLDISFYVDGVEVEPTEAVTVSIDASAIIPEEADASTIEVQHLTETEDGVEATLVADATAETEGTVTVDAETATTVAEFEVESFSSFTITWQYGNGYNQTTSITVNIYDISSGELVASSVETVDPTSFTATSGLSISTLTDAWTVDGYTYVYATVDYSNQSGGPQGGSTTGTVGSSSNSVTTISRSNNTGGGGQGGNSSYTITTAGGSTQTASSISAINLYYDIKGPSVTITATMTDTGYLLTATPVDFTSTENITYNWSISVDDSVATIIDNGNGTATLTWTNGWTESTSDAMDARALANLVTVSVTGTSTYTDENGETVTETGSGSTNVSPYYVTVYVYVAAKDLSGNLFSDEMLELLGINSKTIDGNNYFPAGEIKLDVAFLYGKNYTEPGDPLLTSAGDWTDLLAALSEMDTSTLIDMTGMNVDNSDYAVDYSLNQGNSVGDYLEMAAQDVGYTWGSQHSALFRWNMTTSYGFEDQTVRYHLDLRFSTNTITFKYGTNGLSTDGSTVEYRVYITGSTIQEMKESMTIPNGYKFAGFYEDSTFTTPWDGVGTPITEDETVYIKLVPIKYVVITYQVAIGDGTVTSPDANNVAVKTGYETFDPEDTTYMVIGSTATAADGWEFAGWYLDADCTKPVTESWVTNGHITPSETWSSTETYIYYAKFVQAIYDITLEKVDSKSGETLSSASFILSRTVEDTTTYYVYDEESRTTSWVENEANATPITTGTGGTEVIHSLTTGYTYSLTETVAPDGYNLLTDSITFTVSGGKVTEATYGTGSDSTVVTVSDDGKTITVANTPGVKLPNTGGPGTTLITLLGLLLCGGAGLLLYRRKMI